MNDLLSMMARHGYALTFGLLFAEAIGFPFPAAIALVAAGAAMASHTLWQTGDAIFGGGMRREEAHHGLARERLDDEHVGRGGGSVHGDALGPGFELLQAANERVRRTDVLGGGGVGIVFAGARDGHLNEHGGDGREEQNIAPVELKFLASGNYVVTARLVGPDASNSRGGN